MQLITAKNVQALGEIVNSRKPKTLGELYQMVFSFGCNMKLRYGLGPNYETSDKIISFTIYNSTGKRFCFILDTPIIYKERN